MFDGANVVRSDETAAVIQHDAADLPLADGTVDLVVTSPPYFALRSYRDGGEHYDGQLGSEATPEEFVDNLVACTAEWVRVLKPSGSIWVNLGDKYAGSAGWAKSEKSAASSTLVDKGRQQRQAANAPSPLVPKSDIRSKSLMGLPWRYAIACIDQLGLILRAEVIWSKPNGLPESVTDRVRRSHEQWFHFTVEPRYFSAVDEIREPHKSLDENGNHIWTGKPLLPAAHHEAGRRYSSATNNPIEGQPGLRSMGYSPLGRLPGSVWTVPTEPLQVPDELGVDHFAAFPQEWPRRIIQGWTPNGVCVECGEGRRPIVDKALEVRATHSGDAANKSVRRANDEGNGFTGAVMPTMGATVATVTGYECDCPTTDAPTTPAIVLDPFGGTGTTAGVARALGRYGISNDLSSDYNRLAVWRIWDSGHFNKAEQRMWADRQQTLI